MHDRDDTRADPGEPAHEQRPAPGPEERERESEQTEETRYERLREREQEQRQEVAEGLLDDPLTAEGDEGRTP